MSEAIKCDFHIHSNFSDGALSIAEIIDLYGSRGFGAIAITDHFCETANVIGRVSHRLNFSLSIENFDQYMTTIRHEARRAKEKFGMLVLPGFEITKNSFVNHRSAHILIIGTEEMISPDLPVNSVLQRSREVDALSIAAHPFHTGDFEFQTFQLWSRRGELRHYVDAWEINSRKLISQSVLNSGLPLIANSDFHNLAHWQSWKTRIYGERSWDCVKHSIKQQNLDFFCD